MLLLSLHQWLHILNSKVVQKASSIAPMPIKKKNKYFFLKIKKMFCMVSQIFFNQLSSYKRNTKLTIFCYVNLARAIFFFICGSRVCFLRIFWSVSLRWMQVSSVVTSYCNTIWDVLKLYYIFVLTSNSPTQTVEIFPLLAKVI